MKTSYLLAVCVLAGLPQIVTAAAFDGSKPLICAPVEAHQCLPDEACVTGNPAKLGLPSFLRLDLGKKTIQGTNRTTGIKVIEETDAQILMMGTELEMGWTMALDRETGGVVISMSSSDGAAILFGSCTPL